MFSHENLINTPLQRGEKSGNVFNRLSGLPFREGAPVCVETAEAVHSHRGRAATPLKRGVNEMAIRVRLSSGHWNPAQPDSSSAVFQPAVSQVFNLQGGGSDGVPADCKSAIRQAKSLRYEDELAAAVDGGSLA